MKNLQNSQIEDIKLYFLTHNHTQAQTARNFNLSLPAFREMMKKHKLDKSEYKQYLTARENHPGIIYEIAEDDIKAYREFWKHPPANLNALKRYLENIEIVIDADDKHEQVMDICFIPKVFTKKVPE